MPNRDGNLGSSFFVKYRLKNDTNWINTDQILSVDFIIIDNLMVNTIYDFVVVSVDGKYMAESEIQEVLIGEVGKQFLTRLPENRHLL